MLTDSGTHSIMSPARHFYHYASYAHAMIGLVCNYEPFILSTSLSTKLRDNQLLLTRYRSANLVLFFAEVQNFKFVQSKAKNLLTGWQPFRMLLILHSVLTLCDFRPFIEDRDASTPLRCLSFDIRQHACYLVAPVSQPMPTHPLVVSSPQPLLPVARSISFTQLGDCNTKADLQQRSMLQHHNR